jgi:hypothetical protein
MTEPHGGTRNDIVARLARAQLGRKEDDARKAILRGFAEEGRAPNVHELAHVLGVAVESVREACRTLAGHDLLVWRDDEMCIVSAYPFSRLPTAHQVLIEGDRTLYAMCAIDAHSLYAGPRGTHSVFVLFLSEAGASGYSGRQGLWGQAFDARCLVV